MSCLSQVHQHILDSVGPVDETLSLNPLLHSLKNLQRGPNVCAGSVSLQREVDGIVLLVSNILIGKSPGADFSQLSALAKTMLKKLENAFSCTAMVPSDEAGGESQGGLPFVIRKLQGNQAIQHLFNASLQQFEDAPGELTVESLKPLRVFRWCLTAHQDAQVCELFQEATSNGRPGYHRALLSAEDAVRYAVVPAGQSASSAAGMQALGPLAEPVTKKAKKGAQRDQHEHDDVMSFFRAKSSASQGQ